MDERTPSNRLRFESEAQGGLVEGITSEHFAPKLPDQAKQDKQKRRLRFEEEKITDSPFVADESKRDSPFTADEAKRRVMFEDETAPHDLRPSPHKPKSRLRFKSEGSTGDTVPTEAMPTDVAPATSIAPSTSGQIVPMLDDDISSTGDGAVIPRNSDNSVSKANPNPTSTPKTAKEIKQLEKSKRRIDKAEGKLEKAQDKLAAQKPHKPPGIARQLGSFVAWRYAHRKAHQKIHQVEHENVGTESAHKTELAAEGGICATSRFVKRRIRTRPVRPVRKLTQKSAHAKANHAYRQLLQDNPALKKKALARFFHKQRLKMQYARQAKQAAQVTKQGGSIIARVAAKVTKAAVVLVKSNPKVLLIVAIFLVLVLLLQSCMAMIATIGSGMGGTVVGTSYLAEDADIDDVTVRYTEWETDLHYRIIHAERDNPDYDEYRFNIGDISHNPFELLAFLTAVYNDFTYAQVRATLYDIFNEQYQLEFISEMEIRTRIEERTGTGSWTDDDGYTHYYTYTYTVVVEYEWHILNVILNSQSFRDVILSRMDAEQTERFHVLMLTKGNRQYLQSPFDFNWLPHVTSLYGYRIHPINGQVSRHWGLDIGLPEGTPILSGQDGTVIFAAYSGGYGFLVVIDDGEGLVSRYAHCSILYVNVGDVVSAGDVIARVGNTGASTGAQAPGRKHRGASTGAHLHLEIIKNGRHLNPLIFTVTNHHLALPDPSTATDYITVTVPLTVTANNNSTAPIYISIPIVTNHNPPITNFIAFETNPGAPMSAEMFALLLAEAESHLGTPYVFGANGPNAFDCSSFVCWVFTHSGVYHLPRTTAQGIFDQSIPIPKSEAQPGDLIFFTGTFSTTRTVTHVGIYTGNSFMVHAGSPVSYAYIHTPFWQRHFYSFGRLNW